MDAQTELQLNPHDLIPVHELEPIDFTIANARYRIIYEPTRARLQPKWYVQRMQDLRVTERYYSWPDGAFSAVLWGRAKWR